MIDAIGDQQLERIDMSQWLGPHAKAIDIDDVVLREEFAQQRLAGRRGVINEAPIGEHDRGRGGLIELLLE
ncbi:hypothetical protein D3C78_1470540 [compost metagenome]